ncbi:Ig-like domain-containing domain [Tunicatimonas pelagia]|uniref:Ig-like domain-containing domain n=1 Tax=Tunicatimonas pelagia TaxID=931531 RepID=UPI002665E84B|nr:Ig-like domain-containing domain [Tunicatimonas pelagia]WKN46095.1 Ig-like domain-containing domain [Tunicatimonas pelagia]
MIKQYSWLLALWVLLIMVGSCARQGTPTGGPKDSIPPKLVRMYPELETVNFDEDKIELEFDEYIEGRELKQELIITPPIEDYSFYVSKRTLFLEIEEELRDSTTYTFNFREGIKDASEKNPAENLIVAFSTGPEIDSFQVSGNVRALMTQQPVEDVVVALYDVNDTLDAFTGPPMYLAKTDTGGDYTIRYIREGLYNIYAYVDENGNLKIDSNNEPFGFKSEPVYLGTDINKLVQADSITITDSVYALNKIRDLVIQRQDIRPIRLQSARVNGKYFEIKFNKSLDSYSLSAAERVGQATLDFLKDSVAFNLSDTSIVLFSNFQDEQKVVRIYNTLKQDSLAITISATDSAQQLLPDTLLYLKFTESRRKIADFTTQFISGDNEVTDTISGTFVFSKPVAQINTDSILLSYDTLFYLPIDYSQALQWSEHSDQVGLDVPVDQSQIVDSVIYYLKLNDSSSYKDRVRQQTVYLDSLKNETDASGENRLGWLQQFVIAKKANPDRAVLDSIKSLEEEEAKLALLTSYVDTTQINQQFLPKTYDREEVTTDLRSFNFYASGGSFMSVENDSSEQIIQKFSFKNPEDYGAISGTVTTEYPRYTVQLLNQQFELIREIRDAQKFSFKLVPPGKYQIRILVDADEDGEWEAGSILSQEEPEPVYFYTEEEIIDLRANWERSDLNIIIGELSTLSSE